MDTSILPDVSTLLRDVLPFAMIALLILRDKAKQTKREGADVYTLRRVKKGK